MLRYCKEQKMGIKLEEADETLSSACQRNAPNAAASSNSLNGGKVRCRLSFQKSFGLAVPSNISHQDVDSCHL